MKQIKIKKLLIEVDRFTGTINPQYSSWEQQGQLWSLVQSIKLSPILTRIIEYVHLWKL
jgi:hypothetical protein